MSLGWSLRSCLSNKPLGGAFEEQRGGSPKGHTQVRGVQDCRWHLGTDWTLEGKTCISGNWESYTKRLGLSAVPRYCGLSPFAVPQYSVSVVWARGIQNSFRKCLITDCQIVCIYLSIKYMHILLWLAETGRTCFAWQYGTVKITMQAEIMESYFNNRRGKLQFSMNFKTVFQTLRFSYSQLSVNWKVKK